MRFTEKDVADIFIGQNVIDRKREELCRFLPMINGLLLKRQLATRIFKFSIGRIDHDNLLRIGEVTPESHLRLIWQSSCNEGTSWNYFADRQFENYSLITMLAAHAALPKVINALVEEIPDLKDDLQVFLDQAKEA